MALEIYQRLRYRTKEVDALREQLAARDAELASVLSPSAKLLDCKNGTLVARAGQLARNLQTALEALRTYAEKTTLHSVRNGYAVFNSPGPELAKDTLRTLEAGSGE